MGFSKVSLSIETHVAPSELLYNWRFQLDKINGGKNKGIAPRSLAKGEDNDVN